jgi:lysozyme
MIPIDPKLAAELIRDEGEVLHAYTDSRGFLTIGIGRLIDQRRGGGISHEEAMCLLANDVASKSAELDVKIRWWRQLSPVRQRVLLNMAFNLGVTGLLGFRRMLEAARIGDYATAAIEMKKSDWARQVGDRATRLSEMMRQG